MLHLRYIEIETHLYGTEAHYNIKKEEMKRVVESFPICSTEGNSFKGKKQTNNCLKKIDKVLIDVTYSEDFAVVNFGYKYILTVIDTATKYIWHINKKGKRQRFFIHLECLF